MHIKIELHALKNWTGAEILIFLMRKHMKPPHFQAKTQIFSKILRSGKSFDESLNFTWQNIKNQPKSFVKFSDVRAF